MEYTEIVVNKMEETLRIVETTQLVENSIPAESPVEQAEQSSGNDISSNIVESNEAQANNSIDENEPMILIESTEIEHTNNSNYNNQNEEIKQINNQGPPVGSKGCTLDITGFKSFPRPVSRNGCTIPKSPYFATNYRLRSRNQSIDEQSSTESQFKAHPVNYKILEKQTGMFQVPKKSLTKPIAPKFHQLHTKSRSISQSKLSPKALRNKYTFKNPKYQVKNPVKFKEFKFFTDKSKKIQQEDSKHSPEVFKSDHYTGLIPNYPPPIPTRVNTVPATVPQPFHFASDARCGKTRGKFQNDINESGSSRKHFTANHTSSSH